MKAIFTTFIRKTVVRVMYSMFVDATLGATCGGLYGFVFGGFGALVRDEPHRLFSIAGFFALCGAVVGLLVGAYNAISEADGKSAESSSYASDGDAKDDAPATTVRPLAATSHWRPQNSRVAV